MIVLYVLVDLSCGPAPAYVHPTLTRIAAEVAMMPAKRKAPQSIYLFTPEECRIFFGWEIQRHLDRGVTALRCICPVGQEADPAAWDLLGPA